MIQTHCNCFILNSNIEVTNRTTQMKKSIQETTIKLTTYGLQDVDGCSTSVLDDVISVVANSVLLKYPILIKVNQNRFSSNYS